MIGSVSIRNNNTYVLLFLRRSLRNVNDLSTYRSTTNSTAVFLQPAAVSCQVFITASLIIILTKPHPTLNDGVGPHSRHKLLIAIIIYNYYNTYCIAPILYINIIFPSVKEHLYGSSFCVHFCNIV